MNLLVQAQLQDIQITSLKDNPGILPLKLGQARIQTGTHDFIHYYDLQPLLDEIDTISNQYELITKAIQDGLSHPYFSSLHNFDLGLKYQLNSAKRKLETIYPIHRTKRGLINGLGSIVKAISGNLDQEDAERYNRAIENLQNNQENIIQNLNAHVSITQDLIENFNSTISLINHNQEVINEEINRIGSDLNKFVFDFNHYMRARNVLDQLNLALQTILQLLVDIENSVTFAKIGVLHNSILTLENLNSIVNSMLQHHSTEQIMYTQREQLTKYYEVIKVDAYYSDKKIVFILHFPLLHPDIFAHYHLYSVPTQNSTTIIPPSPFLTMSVELYQYDSTPCMYFDTTYLCQNKLLIQSENKDDCIAQILQLTNAQAHCQHTKVILTTPLIEQLSPAHYIAIFPNHTKISTKCQSSEIQTLQGVYLIHLPKGCEFETSNNVYLNTKSEIPWQPLTLPRVKTTIIQDPDEHRIELNKIPLDGLQKIKYEHEKIYPLFPMRTEGKYTHYWTTPLFIIFTIVLLIIIYRIRERCFKKTTSPEQPKVLFHPHKTSPKEGGVMQSTPSHTNSVQNCSISS